MASVHVCLTHSNSPSFTPSSSSFPSSPVSLLPLLQHAKPRLPVTLLPLFFLVSLAPLALIPLGPFCLSPPDSLSLFLPPFSLFLFAPRLSFTHSHLLVLLLPPASSCSRPSFETFPPSLSLSPSYPSKHPSCHVAI